MEELRLPWSNKEGILFGCVIAFLSSMIIGGYNFYDAVGYGDRLTDFVCDFLIVWPIMFIIAFLHREGRAGELQLHLPGYR